MNAQTQRYLISGPEGNLECALDMPGNPPKGVALVCHPHPLGGGTLDNKVVQTIARALVQWGWATLRFNYRGVGRSEGQWSEGVGEVADAHVALAHARSLHPALPWLVAGFSFGGFVAAQLCHEVKASEAGGEPQHLLLVAPSTQKQKVPLAPADTVVIHGELDDIVPLQSTLDWARPQSLPITVLPGGGHFFHGQLPSLRRLVLQQLAGHSYFPS